MTQNIIQIQYISLALGELIVGDYNHQLCLCDWRYRKMRKTVDKRVQKGLQAIFNEGTTPLLEAVKLQLSEYANRERKVFDIPILFVGTDFQKKVWNALLEIPYGQTRSYLQLSKHLDNKKAIRAVASANGANALSIIVPCHRIVGSDGKLVGYSGGLQVKRQLLNLESACKYQQLELFE